MQRLILFFLILISFNTSYSQIPTLHGLALLDSLKSEIPNAKGDTNEVNIYRYLSFELYAINPLEGIEFAHKGLSLSKKINWTLGEGVLYKNIAMSYVTLNQLDSCFLYYGKANELLSKEEDKSEYSNSLLYYAFVKLRLGKLIESERFIDSSSNIAKRIDYIPGIIRSLHLSVLLSLSKGKIEPAKEYLDQALELAKTLSDKLLLGQTYEYYSKYYISTSIFSKSIESHLKAMKIYEEIGDETRLIRTNVELAGFYQFTKNAVKGLKYAERGLELSKKTKNVRFEAMSNNYLGAIYNELDQPNKALIHLNKALDHYGNSSFIDKTVIFGNLAMTYQKLKDYDKAIELYQQVVDISTNYNIVGSLLPAKYFLATLYFELSQDSIIKNISEETNFVKFDRDINLNRSIKYFEEAMSLSERFKDSYFRMNSSKYLSDLYERKGDIKSAFTSLKTYQKFKDSVYNEKEKTTIDSLINERNTLENLREEKERKLLIESEISRRNTLQYLALGSLVVFMIVLLLLSGKIRFKEWMARALVFMTFILMFEFLLVMLDPVTDDYSEGEPIVKFAINLLLGLIIFPMHQFFERKVTTTLLKKGQGSSIEKVLNDFKSNK